VPYATAASLPEPVKALPKEARQVWQTVFNAAYDTYKGDESKAFPTAWAALKRAGWKKSPVSGRWVKVGKRATVRIPLAGGARIVPIAKIDADQRRVFGWAYIAVEKSGRQVPDLQGDVIDPEELEETGYDHVLEARASDAMHDKSVVGRLIESVVFTPEKIAKLGLPVGSLPCGWWVGYQIDDDATWSLIRKGVYRAFSVGGTALRTPLVASGAVLLRRAA
jgi:cation transport regulator ChaB